MASTYEAIYSYTGNGSSALVSFSSIPSTYTDLRVVVNGVFDGNGDQIVLRINSDSGSNYSNTYLTGNGSAASSSRYSSQTIIWLTPTQWSTTDRSTLTFDVMNYTNTTTYKTVIARNGRAGGGTDAVVGLWRSTAAVSSLNIYCNTGYSSASTTYTLYGIKAA